MKNRSKLMRRLSVVAALAVVLALAAGTPALQAQPEVGTIYTGAGVQVWNGHNCPANVPVSISGLTTGLGGYEAKIAWQAGRFNNTPASVGVTLLPYLAVNGRVNSQAPSPPIPGRGSAAQGCGGRHGEIRRFFLWRWQSGRQYG